MSDIGFMQTIVVAVLIIGLIITVVSWDIDNKLQSSACTSTALKTANKTIMCIGVALMVMGLSYYACNMRCPMPKGRGSNYLLYIMILFLLGTALIVLGAIVSANATGHCQNSGSPTIIWSLGALIVIFCVVTFKKEQSK